VSVVASSEQSALESLTAARLRGAPGDEVLGLGERAIEQARGAADATSLELIADELESAAAMNPEAGGALRRAAARARASTVGSPTSLARVSTSRRAAAFALDTALLLAGLLLVLFVGATIANAEEADWVALMWVVVVAPLYFALYHAFGGPEGGPGATPGQHELSLCLRDTETGDRLRLRRALLRSYGGLLAAVTVFPLLVDLLGLVAKGGGRAWHDGLFRSAVVRVRSAEPTLADRPPTTPELSAVFAAGGPLRARTRQLAQIRYQELMRPVSVLYLGLVGLATVLVPMMVADLDSNALADGLAMWTVLSFLIFFSGIYWTQAVLVTAVEAARIGERVSTARLIRRASEHANALTVAFLLLAALLFPVFYTAFLLLPLAARFALVVPAIVLEDAPVLKAFGRSWQLTRGKTARAFLLLLASGAIVGATVSLALGVAFGIVSAVIPDAGLWVYCLGAAVALVLSSLLVSLVLTRVGSAWCLFYYDSCRDDALRRAERRQVADGEAGGCATAG
jgi:RDD family/Membrane domain of glycerophosphoryl diester phosphodiesterase